MQVYHSASLMANIASILDRRIQAAADPAGARNASSSSSASSVDDNLLSSLRAQAAAARMIRVGSAPSALGGRNAAVPEPQSIW